MPLQHFYEEQIRHLRIFLNTPGEKLRVLLTDEDTKVVTHRLLAGLDDSEDVTSVFLPTDAAYTTPAAFFERAYADVTETFRVYESELAAERVIAPPEWNALKARFPDPAERFARGLATFSNALPEEIGALAVLIDPASVSDPAGYRKALKYLAENTPSQWVKYVVIDDRVRGHAVELAKELPALRVQSMYLPPAELEKRVKWHLATGVAVGAVERRVYTGVLAGFALSAKNYDEAIRLNTEQLALTAAEGTPNDLAAVQYNLGNAHLAKKDFPAAVETYTDGLGHALKTQPPTPLVPTILTNLGVALFQGGEPAKAAEAFAAARGFARKLNQKPIEAHTLDCMAKCHAAADRPAEAEKCWNEALAAYDGITADSLKQCREGGRKLVLVQLEQHYQRTRQPDKLAAVREELTRGDS